MSIEQYEDKYDLLMSARDFKVEDGDFVFDPTNAAKAFRCVTIKRGKWPGGRLKGKNLGNDLYNEKTIKKTQAEIEKARGFLYECLEQLEKTGRIKIDNITTDYMDDTLCFVISYFDFAKQKSKDIWLDTALFT